MVSHKHPANESLLLAEWYFHSPRRSFRPSAVRSTVRWSWIELWHPRSRLWLGRFCLLPEMPWTIYSRYLRQYLRVRRSRRWQFPLLTVPERFGSSTRWRTGRVWPFWFTLWHPLVLTSFSSLSSSKNTNCGAEIVDFNQFPTPRKLPEGLL